MKRLMILAALSILALSCGRNAAVELLPVSSFETVADGKEVSLYTLKGGDLTMQVTNFGGRVVSLWVPDKDGLYEDIVLGYNNIDNYINNPGERFLGAVVGPYANRIAGGTYTIGDETYNFPQNNNGQTLHGGLKGLDMIVWNVDNVCENSITLSVLCPDGHDGMPGNRTIIMTYTLTSDNEFKVEYSAMTDKATHMNISHHSFFNLKGEGNGTINDHVLYINASKTTPVDALLIPTGEIADVTGTPFDFREPKAIGRDLGVEMSSLPMEPDMTTTGCLTARLPRKWSLLRLYMNRNPDAEWKYGQTSLPFSSMAEISLTEVQRANMARLSTTVSQ